MHFLEVFSRFVSTRSISRQLVVKMVVPVISARATTGDNTEVTVVVDKVTIKISLIEVVSLLTSGRFRSSKLRHLLACDKDSTRGSGLRGNTCMRMTGVVHARLVLEPAQSFLQVDTAASRSLQITYSLERSNHVRERFMSCSK